MPISPGSRIEVRTAAFAEKKRFEPISARHAGLRLVRLKGFASSGTCFLRDAYEIRIEAEQRPKASSRCDDRRPRRLPAGLRLGRTSGSEPNSDARRHPGATTDDQGAYPAGLRFGRIAGFRPNSDARRRPGATTDDQGAYRPVSVSAVFPGPSRTATQGIIPVRRPMTSALTPPVSVSVVLPVFTRSTDHPLVRLLRRALEAVSDRRYPGAFEMLSIDDGSPAPVPDTMRGAEACRSRQARWAIR